MELTTKQIIKKVPVFGTVKDGKKTKREKIGEEVYYKRSNNTIGIKYFCLDQSRALQSQHDETNINHIVKKYSNREIFNNFVFDENGDNIIDVSEITDYHSALNQIAQAQEQFEALPVRIRKFFGHDPVKMVEYCSDPSNLEGMQKLGLANPPLPEPKDEAPLAKPAASQPAGEKGEPDA